MLTMKFKDLDCSLAEFRIALKPDMLGKGFQELGLGKIYLIVRKNMEKEVFEKERSDER